ncbi:sensor histidine kinase [Paenibacillus brasilensis]|uniref:histidine kinase n=1 Tax=Paenibacillus brasilensis TaxID=128574 RepID=A0ABU0L6F2_9BACL|nr:HAMP domain-containing sensor histidine kinase [Paenibacillus brasilensis]MDQ0496877.1 signal transduction histidine kinase [Paenibacillus brasilensis]
MEFIFVLLLIPAAIIYFRNPKDEATRWLTFFMASSASGSFSRMLRLYVLPDLDPESFWTLVVHGVRFGFYFLSHHVFHYGLLMYAIIYSLGASFKYKKTLTLFLLAPLIYSILLTPWHDYSKQLETISYFYWTTAYDLFAACLIIYAYRKETNIIIKKSRHHNALIFIPTIFAIVLFVNIRNTFMPSSLVNRTIIVFTLYSFIVFVVLAIRNGVLGVKIQINNHVLHSTARATANSTDIINHTIKDEMNKIRMIIDRTRLESAHKEKGEILTEFSKLYTATDQVLEFVDRIRDQTQDVELRKARVSLPHIVRGAVEDIEHLATINEVKIKKRFLYTGTLNCDQMYIREVVKNLLKNSIEAMTGKGGHITIEIYQNKRKTYISVTDNGCGIPESILAKVKEPFFSTKNNKHNYGLGLNFCSNVMQKHGGHLEVFSENEGATVVLIFPSK